MFTDDQIRQLEQLHEQLAAIQDRLLALEVAASDEPDEDVRELSHHHGRLSKLSERHKHTWRLNEVADADDPKVHLDHTHDWGDRVHQHASISLEILALLEFRL